MFREIDSTIKDLENFANEGLRTLILAEREIPQEEYAKWAIRYQKAITSISDREELVENAQNDIEINLKLVGATAIDDKLQDKVPETIYNITSAGIQVWVLTGDKMETAINIGYSCRLLDNSYQKLVLDGSFKSEIEDQISNIRNSKVFFLFSQY